MAVSSRNNVFPCFAAAHITETPHAEKDSFLSLNLFVFPSVFEGLGLVLIEAQASELDCVASDKVPIEANAANAVKYLNLDEKLWVDEILMRKKDYDLNKRENKSKESVRLIQQNGYDINLNAQKLLEIYNTRTA